jgi:hypothetical protein
MSNWRRRGSSLRSVASHELSVLRHKIEEDIIYSNVDTNRIKLSHRPNGEGGKRQSQNIQSQENFKKISFMLLLNFTFSVYF